MDRVDSFRQFFQDLDNLSSEQLLGLVEGHLDDEDIEVIVTHIEAFYGIDDEEQLGVLAQLLITGYLLGKNEFNPLDFHKKTTLN